MELIVVFRGGKPYAWNPWGQSARLLGLKVLWKALRGLWKGGEHINNKNWLSLGFTVVSPVWSPGKTPPSNTWGLIECRSPGGHLNLLNHNVQGHGSEISNLIRNIFRPLLCATKTWEPWPLTFSSFLSKVDTIINPILLRSKLRHRKVDELAQVTLNEDWNGERSRRRS